MTTFENALKTGKVLVRKTWENQNSPGQISVQFMQRVKSPANVTASPLVLIAQGIDAENAGYNKVTTILSFAEDFFNSLGIDLGDVYLDADYAEGSNLFADNIFGEEVTIHVVENTTIATWVDDDGVEHERNQDPKRNPRTMEILTFNGQPIYRHTELVPVSQEVENIFLRHNGTMEDAEALENAMANANNDANAVGN